MRHGKVPVSRESIANAVMVTGAFDRINGTKLNPIYQPYNDFSVRTIGGNIIQGQVNRVQVTEVMFPYAIPTIINFKDGADAANNLLLVSAVSTTVAAGVLTTVSNVQFISLAPGFYTGTEMEAAINAQLVAFPPIWADLICAFNPTNNRFSFTNTSVWDAANGAGTFYNLLAYATGTSSPLVQLQKPRLAWTLGLRSIAAKYPPILPTNAAAVPAAFGTGPGPVLPWLVPQGYTNDGAPASVPALPVWPANYAVNRLLLSPYTGRYTDYIDIVSHNLCGAQFVRDGNTNQNTVRRDIIARLYIADEVSIPPYETGSRPFVIHRQFQNPKTMFWNVERSIDSIDLQLYDMYGQPLPTGLGMNALLGGTSLVGDPGDYAITFLVEEGKPEEQNANVGVRFS